MMLYPVPTVILNRQQLMAEYASCMTIAGKIKDVYEGLVKLEDDPEVARWFMCQTALYDRCRESLTILSEVHGVDVNVIWPLKLQLRGGESVYPKYTRKELLEKLDLIKSGQIFGE